jgi:acetyl esterase
VAAKASRLSRRFRILRQKVRHRALNAAFAGLGRLANLDTAVRASRAKIEIIRDVAYGSHRVAHRLDVYRPRFAPRPLPVLMYIHGGGFALCSKDTHCGIALAKADGAGHLVFNINYRLAPGYPFPAAIEDACDAYRWVIDNAKRYGGDPSRITVAGESAGGNLALGVAIAATYKRPEAYARAVFERAVVPVGVMPICPYLQCSDPDRHASLGGLALGVVRDIATAYLGDSTTVCKKFLMADPIRVLEECGPPWRRFPEVFSGVGTTDLCCEDVERLEEACRGLGIPCTVHYYPNEMHAFHALRWRAASRRFWNEMFRFMRRVARRPRAAVPRVALHALRRTGS